MLADNRLAELSGWDPALLRIELGALVEIDLKGELSFDIGVIGFETPELLSLIGCGTIIGSVCVIGILRLDCWKCYRSTGVESRHGFVMLFGPGFQTSHQTALV